MGDSTIFISRDAIFFKEFNSANWVVYALAHSISPQGKGEYKAITKSQGDLGISQTQVSDLRLLYF